MESSYLEYYFRKLGYLDMPQFLKKYLNTPSLLRLKKVGYFCGMDYASRDVYQFREYISRYDHSVTVCLMTYYLTNDKTSSLAGLFHDIATPCFSHVIDYMNNDYEKQESTEEYTERILKSDAYLLQCLNEDKIDVNDIIHFKKYSIVDNDRPKSCADRIDGVILTGISWTKNITKKDIDDIIQNMYICINEYGEQEIGFKTYDTVKKIVEISKSIDLYCHSNEDHYMMQLLAKITKYAIDREYISYDELYLYNEEQLFDLLKKQEDIYLKNLLNEFENKKVVDIPVVSLPPVKIRKLSPLINNKRWR